MKNGRVDNQYAIQNARHRIDGYYFPTPTESMTRDGRIAAFNRAKEECIRNMRADLEVTAAMTPEMYWPKMKAEGGAA